MSFFSNYIYIIDEFEEELIMNYYEEIKDLIEKKEVKDGEEVLVIIVIS